MFRCYECSPPDDPPHGSWDCDLLKNGDTVCMLQCEVYTENVDAVLVLIQRHEHTFVYRLDSPLKGNT